MPGKKQTTQQISIFNNPSTDENVFRRNIPTSKHMEALRKHKAWLELIRHEYPLPEKYLTI